MSKLANTIARAERLVALLDEAGHDLTDAHLLDYLPESVWQTLAELDNGRRISTDTRTAMRSILAARELRVANPFAGLPS